jgi:hypothetical protein
MKVDNIVSSKAVSFYHCASSDHLKFYGGVSVVTKFGSQHSREPCLKH